MYLAIAILVAHALIVPAAAVAFFFQRWRSNRGRRRGHRRFGFYPSAAAAGNALQSLQALMQPQIQHVLEEKLDEPANEDDSSGPDDPLALFHRQARRIRRGQPIDRLRIRLPPPA